jgi:hypothetical protein
MKRTLIVLLAALALLVAVLLKNKSNEKAMQRDVPALDSARKADVKSIQVIKKPDTSSLEMKDGKWVIAKDGFPVDTGKVNRVLKYLFAVQTKEKVSTNKDRNAEYGLDTTEAKHVTLKDGSGKAIADLVVGKTSGADYSSTYWKWESGADVYRTPGNFAWEIGTKEDEWKDRKLFSFGAKDLKFIEADWKDSTGAPYHYKLEATTDSTWKMLEPQDSNRVVKALTGDMASRMVDMSIDDFVTPKDTNLAKVNVDSPMVSIKATLKDGKTREIKATKVLDGYAYSRHPDRSDVIKISSWRLDTFKKKPFQLLEAPPADTTKKDSAKTASTPPAAGVKPPRAAIAPKDSAKAAAAKPAK